MAKTYQQVSHLYNDHSTKWISRVTNDTDLVEHHSITKQLLSLCSIATTFAQCFDDACQEMRRVLAAIQQPVSPSIKNNVREARQQLLIAMQVLRRVVERRTILQNDLKGNNRQLNSRFLIKST